MSQIILNETGQEVTKFQISEDSFSGAEGAAEDRYRESIGSEPSLVVIISNRGNPLGYCSYLTYFPLNHGNSFNVLINYIYVKPNHRLSGLTLLMARAVIRDLLDSAKSQEGISSYFDISQYISEGGCKFGEEIRKGLCDGGLICENM